MRVSVRRILVSSAAAGAAFPSSPARADFVHDLAFGLGYAGVDFQGNRNILSGGVDLLATTTFRGNTQDFGPGDLTLSGPLSLSLSTGGRGLSELQLGLRSAPNATATATPLNYTLNLDVGGESTRVAGNVLMDTSLKLNNLGFYSLQVRYSSRQNVTRTGADATDTKQYDFDVGPINVRGNVLADALVAITNPLYEAAGQTNPFAGLSGTTQLKQAFAGQSQAAIEKLAAGGDTTDADLARMAGASIANQVLAGAGAGLLPAALASGAASTRRATVVPEPTVLILMLLGAPLIFRAGLRRRQSGNAIEGP
jgi:hypothetical protein